MAPTILSKLWKLTSKILSIIPSPSFDLPESSVEPTTRKEILGSSVSSVKSTIAEEIEKLRQMVTRIQATVVDAEERDVTDESVKLRLLDLKQVAYEGENILNDFDYELLSIDVKRKVQVNNPKRKFEVIDSIVSPTFDESILLQIKKFNESFAEITQFWTILSLSEVDGVRKSQANYRSPSDSLMNSSEIFGRHDCKSHIIRNMLTAQSGWDNIKIISIVSMGGMGKTTLAKLVYNDEMVEKHFDVRSWVWVSECFDEVAISRSILESVDIESCDFVYFNHLQTALKEKLQGKRFLIVLDDLWNENQENWNTILRPLLSGAEGSCILITTRNFNVARIGRTNILEPLGGLPENDSWALFCHYAFNGVHSSSLPKKLVKIGQNIVEKCKGFPLLIKTLGCLLSHENKEDYWEYILHSEVWELEECKMSIIPVLKLSYYLLPSHLKPCFTYCAAFPKGHAFELDNLVHLWIAQGFIAKHPRKQMEEIGLMYAHNLLQRSFFEDVSSAMNCTYKVRMHDLMHDLAQAITSEEILITEIELLNEICSRKSLRHLTILVTSRTTLFNRYVSLSKFLEGISLRSLIIIGSDNSIFSLEENIFDNPSLSNLCVLDLNFWAADEVPSSISNLKHLRYLGLSGQQLPECICDLYHLETLNLRKNKYNSSACFHLPRNIDHLINLRHLFVDPWDISMLPQGIGSLTNLQSLSVFALSKNCESASLRELKDLNNLRGTLQISNLDHTMHEQSLDANLSSKNHLKHLILSFRKEILSSQTRKDVLPEVLMSLRPLTNIQEVTLQYYEGPYLASWFQDRSFSKLTNIKLQDCSECKQLPAFGQLQHLKYLKLENFSSLENVGSEILGNEIIAFPHLEVLVIYDMLILRKWCYGEEIESKSFFPQLREVHLSLCMWLRLFQIPTISPLDKLNASWCDRLETIYGLNGSWSVISQWKSILDSSKGKTFESVSTLHHTLNILDSRVLKLQKDSEAGKPLPAHLKLTIVGCPMLQQSYLTCKGTNFAPPKWQEQECANTNLLVESNHLNSSNSEVIKNRNMLLPLKNSRSLSIANNKNFRSTRKEILPSNVGDGNYGFLKTFERNLRWRRPDFHIPGVVSNPITSHLSELVTYVRSSILKNPDRNYLNNSSEYSDDDYITEGNHAHPKQENPHQNIRVLVCSACDRETPMSTSHQKDMANRNCSAHC